MSMATTFIAPFPCGIAPAPRPRKPIPGFLRTKDLEAATGLSSPTIYRLRAQGLFVDPDFRWGRSVGWLPETVQKWCEATGRNG